MTDQVQVIAKRPSSENPVIIEGFPGVGLVGNIASQYIVNELKMDYLGAVESRFFPPLSVLLGGLAKMPVRIYEKADLGIVMITSDVPIHPAACYDVAKGIISWIESVNAKEMICLAGISIISDQRRIFGAATTEEMLDRIHENLEALELGTISGISGSVMNECLVRGLPAMCILGEVHSMAPDPVTAVATVNMLNKLYNLGVDTTKLEERAQEIELQMQRLADQVKTAAPEDMGKPELPGPMYG